MDQILMCSNKIPAATSIRNSFIQKYMLDANGSYVKVYLYLSMCIQSSQLGFSISSLADLMENTENDIIRALQHWEKKNLLRITWHESKKYIVGIEFLDPDEAPASSEVRSVAKTPEILSSPTAQAGNAQEQTAALCRQDANVRPHLSDLSQTQSPLPDFAVTSEQSSAMADNNDFTWICQIVETFLNRPVKPVEVQLLIYLFDTLHFSKDLILHLYDYCISLGKSNVKYIQAVALSWAENHVTTPEQAQKFSTDYSSVHTAISKALGLNRTLASVECQYVKRWHDEWKLDLSVILEACDRTLLAIQRPDFKYIDGILKNWHKEHVRSLQDVAKCDEQHAEKMASKTNAAPTSHYRHAPSPKKNQFQDFPQRNMPEEKMNQLERLLLSE